MTPLPKAILLMGPTASGKTAAALSLADKFPVGLISVDSALVFRDMNIGTAKPDAETLQRYPHQLVDLISPEETYSAAQFLSDAQSAMAAMTAQGITPLLVGGTMLYYKALLEGLAELPASDASTRAKIDAIAQQKGWSGVHDELAKHDPITAQRLHPTDSQRLQRALEICLLAKRPMSALLAESQAQKPPYQFLSLGLLPSDRSVLHARIAERFDIMLAQGFENEVTRLRQKYTLTANLPSMRCVGYRQVWEAQDGIIPRSELRDRGIFATRQLAKRQITWMNNTLNTEGFDCLASDTVDAISRRVDAFLS